MAPGRLFASVAAMRSMTGPSCQRRNSMKNLRLAAIALGAGLTLTGTAFAQDLTVGIAGPMTGGEATFGRQMNNGAELAVADINAAGGVLGKKLKLEAGDDACDPKQARSVGEKFASMKVPFVAGHYCSSSSIPASEAYAEGNVLQITPASTNPTFTERGLWNTFRVCGRDDQQGAVAGAYIAKNYKGKNVAVLHDKTTYGKGLADETKKALNKAGVKEKLYEAYNKGDKDFTALVAKFKAKNIDPEGYTLYTYAAFQVWSQAAAKAGTTDPKKVAETIRAGSWDTVLGKIAYDKKGDITVIDYVVYKWDKNGNYAELGSGS